MPIVAQVTVLKKITHQEREHRYKGERLDTGGYQALLVHIDKVIRGTIPVSEIELANHLSCTDEQDYLPGASGIVAAYRLVDTGEIYGTGQHGVFWTLQITATGSRKDK